MPAVCEEAMHRGFIQYSFRSVRSDFVIIFSMGLIFGIFHMDPYRFLPTALLGMGLSYIMQKTHNLLLPALFHFINNFISFLSTLGASTENAASSALLFANHSYLLLALGSYLVIGSLAPILLFAGSYLLRQASGSLTRRSEKTAVASVIVILTICGIMLIAGFCIVLFHMDAFIRTQNFPYQTEGLM